MSQITYTIQTALNPELFRQAFEMILGQSTGSNQWYINTSGPTAILSDETVVQLTQEQVNYVGTFIEATPSFSSKFYSWDADLGEFKENITVIREDAKLQIDTAAGKTRSKYLTSIPGQDATYIAKETECRAFLKDLAAIEAQNAIDEAAAIEAAAAASVEGQPPIEPNFTPVVINEASYPWVQAESEAIGLTAKETAEAIATQADQWRVIGSTIEKIRRSGKIEVDKKLKASTIATSLAATLAALQAL